MPSVQSSVPPGSSAWAIRLRRFGSLALPVPPVGVALLAPPWRRALPSDPPPSPLPPLPPLPHPGGRTPTPNGVSAAARWFSVPAPSARPATMGSAYSLPAGLPGSKVTPGSAAWTAAGKTSTAPSVAITSRRRIQIPSRWLPCGIDANSRLRAGRQRRPFTLCTAQRPTRVASPVDQLAAGGVRSPSTPPPASRQRRGRRGLATSRAVRAVLLAVVGTAAGVSTVVGGFYDLTVWGPIAVGMFALVLALVITGVGRPRLAPALAVGSLAFLW